MSATPEDLPPKLRYAPELRERLRERLDRYLDLPLALASILLVLIAVIELGGEVAEPWEGRLAVLEWALGWERDRDSDVRNYLTMYEIDV